MAAPGYLQVFQQRWVVIATSVIGCLLLAAVVSVVLPSTYTAKATLFLSVKSPTASLAELSQFSLARVGSYPDLVYSDDVLTDAIEILGTDATKSQVASQVSAANPNGTVLVEVTAEARTATAAADLANAVAAGLSTEVADIENSPGSTYTVDLDLRIPADPPASPSAPQRVVILGLGLVAGLAIGAALALLLAQLDTRLRTGQDVRRVAGLPVFGRLRRPRRVGGAPVIDPEGDGYVEAVLNLRQANGGVVPTLLLLATPSRGSAPDHVRVGLAQAYAEAGREVVLLETAAEPGSSVPGISDLAERPGLGDLLASGRTDLTNILRPVHVEGPGEVWAIPRGIDAPSELVAEAHFPPLAFAIADRTDLAIIQMTSQSRPLTLHAVVPVADVVVIVARHGKTTEADLARMVTDLRLEGVPPIGVVFADVPRRHHADLAADWHADDFASGPRRVPMRPEAEPQAIPPEPSNPQPPRDTQAPQDRARV